MPGAMNRKKTTITLLFLMAAAGYLIRFEGPSNEAAAKSAQVGDPKALEAGKRHLEARCAPRHRAEGKGGEGGAHTLSSERARERSAQDPSEFIPEGSPAALTRA